MDNETVVLLNENKLPENELEKYFALKALKSNPGILGNFFSFEKLVYVLNDIKPNVDVWEPPSILMFAKAVHLLQKLGELPNKWHPEIKEYLAQVARTEGWVELPAPLAFANPELKSLHRNDELDEEAKRIQVAKHEAVKEYLNGSL